jgi:thiamine-phosphate diphosphorylase
LALQGGATVVEGRGKGFTTGDLLLRYREMLLLCQEFGVPFLVNDRPDVALVLDAAGAHVGPEDLPPVAARRVLGDRWLGVSARTEDRLREAEAARATYVGIGALRATSSKEDALVLGVSGITALVNRTEIPVVVIGGVLPEDLPDLRRAGAVGVAVGSGILDQPDPEAAARRYVEAWEGWRSAPPSRGE